METDKGEGWWETADFYLACFLKAKGCKIIQTRKVNEKEAIFRLEVKDENILKRYYNREESVEPLSYAMAIKELRGFCRLKK